MTIRQNGEVWEIVNKKSANYEYKVIQDLMELCIRQNIFVELVEKD